MHFQRVLKIMDKGNKIKKNDRFFPKGLITIYLLFLLPLFITCIYIFKTGDNFSIPEYSYSKDIYTTVKNTELLAGDKIQGEFFAQENNLGIVSIRFNTFNRINTDIVVFRIKEKNQKEWYYEQNYESSKFGGYPFFPFGFPIIAGSKDKSYMFVLESLKGEPGKAVAIATENPTIVAKHKFSKAELLSNKKDLIRLSLRKVFYSIGREDVIKCYVQSIVIVALIIFIFNLRKKKHLFVFKFNILDILNKIVNPSLKFFPKLKSLLILVWRISRSLYAKLSQFYQWANG